MCGVKVTDRFVCNELRERERLEIDYIIILVQHNRLIWFGCISRKDKNDWVKEYVDFELEGVKPRSRPKRTWSEVVETDFQIRKLCKGDAVDHSKWRQLVKDIV